MTDDLVACCESRIKELEKLLLMIAETALLNFDEEGWKFYDKVMPKLTHKE